MVHTIDTDSKIQELCMTSRQIFDSPVLFPGPAKGHSHPSLGEGIIGTATITEALQCSVFLAKFTFLLRSLNEVPEACYFTLNFIGHSIMDLNLALRVNVDR